MAQNFVELIENIAKEKLKKLLEIIGSSCCGNRSTRKNTRSAAAPAVKSNPIMQKRRFPFRRSIDRKESAQAGNLVNEEYFPAGIETVYVL